MKILIDALSMTWKYDNVGNLWEQLGLQNAETHPMRAKYYQHGDYFDGVLIAYNMDSDGLTLDTFLDISGKGCRTVEAFNQDFDWFDFLHQYDEQLRSGQCHISRIDIACDCTDTEVSMKDLYRYSYSGKYICRSKVLPDLRMLRTEEIYFGSPRSDRLLRIYNKALEQGIPDTYWLRFEFQLRNDCAMSWYLNWCNCPDVGKLYSGVMLDYLRFVDIPPGWGSIDTIKRGRNQSMLPTARFWSRMLGEVERIPQLYLPGETYTIEKLERYLERQTYSSLKTYAIAHDGDLSKLLDGVKHANLNTKQKQILLELEKQKITKSDLEE